MGPSEIDNINWLLNSSKRIYTHICSYLVETWLMWVNLITLFRLSWMITLTVITLSSIHCKKTKKKNHLHLWWYKIEQVTGIATLIDLIWFQIDWDSSGISISRNWTILILFQRGLITSSKIIFVESIDHFVESRRRNEIPFWKINSSKVKS